jgi:hypothetical protein
MLDDAELIGSSSGSSAALAVKQRKSLLAGLKQKLESWEHSIISGSIQRTADSHATDPTAARRC